MQMRLLTLFIYLGKSPFFFERLNHVARCPVALKDVRPSAAEASLFYYLSHLPSSFFFLLPPPPLPLTAQTPLKHTYTPSKTSAAVIEACAVAISLPVRICLRPQLISASGVQMSARIRMIYLQLSWKYASNTPEVFVRYFYTQI